MEALSGNLLNVVLKIKEGNGFGFLSSPIVIIANLNGNALETEPITCTASPTFGSDFIWEAEKKILRRMRSGNTSLRIECMCQKNCRKREKIGYILLNLKQAQIINSENASSVNESWYRLLGVRPEMKPHNPEILLSLLIKEADFPLDQPSKNSSGKSTQKGAEECGYIQIGPAPEATQLFSFSMDIAAAVNLHSLIDEDKKSEGITVSCLMFGTYFTSGDLSRVNGDLSGERLHLTIRSAPNLLAQYFIEFPKVDFCLLNGVDTIAKSSLHLQSFVAGCHSLRKQGSVSKEGRVWFCDETKAYIDVTVAIDCEGKIPGSSKSPRSLTNRSPKSAHQSSAKQSNSTSHRPTVCGGDGIDMIPEKLNLENKEVKKGLKKGYFEIGKSFGMKSKAFNLSPKAAREIKLEPDVRAKSPSPRFKAVQSSSPKKDLPSPTSHKPALQIPEMAPPQTNEGKASPLVSNQPIADMQTVYKEILPVIPLPDNCTAALLQNSYSLQPPSLLHIAQESTQKICLPVLGVPYHYPVLDEKDSGTQFPPPVPNGLISNDDNGKTREIARNVIEELEDWKEKQQTLYKIELKTKCEKEVKRLTIEWSKRQVQLEEEMTKRVEDSAQLTEQLHKSAAELAHRISKVTETQSQLENEKERLESEYGEKLKELRDASKKYQAHMSKQLKSIKNERDELKRQLCVTSQELDRYRSGNIVSPTTSQQQPLTDNQMTSILVDMKCLEEKLFAALESKEFFRKEWGRALREIHRMKTEQESLIKQQLDSNRNELNNLRLVGLICDDEKESKEDMASIRNLKLELTRLIPNKNQLLVS